MWKSSRGLQTKIVRLTSNALRRNDANDGHGEENGDQERWTIFLIQTYVCLENCRLRVHGIELEFIRQDSYYG